MSHSHTKDDFANTLRDSKKTVEHAAEGLRDDAREAMDHARESAAEFGRRTRHAAAQGLEHGREFAEKAGEVAGNARSAVEDRIRAHPLAAIGLAVGVGVLIATLSRRR
jgi:ElaB/YqjD/DUF883 family membrane-anchored ribosome-binding protein